MDVAFGSRFQFELNIKGRKTIDAKTKYYNTLVNDLCAHMKSKPGHNSTIEKEIKNGVKFHERRGLGSFHVPDEFDEGIKTEFRDELNKKYQTDKGDHLIILGENFKIAGNGENTYCLDRNKHRNISARAPLEMEQKKAQIKTESLIAKERARRQAKIEEAAKTNLLAENNKGVEIKSKLQLMINGTSNKEQNEQYAEMLKKDLIDFVKKTAPNKARIAGQNFTFHKLSSKGSILLPEELGQESRKEFINTLREKYTNKKGKSSIIVQNYKKKSYNVEHKSKADKYKRMRWTNKKNAEWRAKIEEAKELNLLTEKNNGTEIKSKLQIIYTEPSGVKQNKKYAAMLKKDLIKFLEKTAPDEIEKVEQSFKFHNVKGQGSIILPEELSQEARRDFINTLRGKYTNEKGKDVLVVQNYKRKAYGVKPQIEKTQTEIKHENKKWKKNEFNSGNFVYF